MKAPAYVQEDGEEKLVYTGPRIMDDQDLQRWLGSVSGGKNLHWTNYFIDIEDDSLENKGTKEYKGQWKSESKNVWEGFGVLKFSDGSVY